MDFRQSIPFADYLASCGWKKETIDKTVVFIRKVGFLGSVIRIPRSTVPIPFVKIDQLAKKHHAFLIKIEPNAQGEDFPLSALRQQGYVKDTWSLEPTKTTIIDLNLSEEILLTHLKPKWRQYVRLAQRAEVSVKVSQDIDTFIAVWQKNAAKKHHHIESTQQTKALWKACGKNSELLFVSYDCDILAAAFLIYWENTCILWHLGYGGEYKEFRSLYLLVWEAIRKAKAKKMQYFDFDGIGDDRYPYSKKVQPTFFKSGFGGREKIYIGSFTKYTGRFRSIPYRIMSFLNPELFRFFTKSSYD